MKANLLGAAALVTGALGLAACGDQRVIPPPQQTQQQAPAPRPPAAPAVPAPKGWADYPATPGDWRWSLENGQSVARFATTRLVLRCDLTTRSVNLQRSEPGAALSAPTPLKVITQTQSRQYTAIPQAGALAITIAARDPLLDAIAFSKGRFAVETAGLPTLYVPSWTEVSRVVEDCR